MRRLQAYLSGPRRTYAVALAAAVALLAAIAIATSLFGDGSPKTFTAQSFVDEANGKGAKLVLGEPLISAQEDLDIYGISFEEPGAGDGQAKKPGDAGGGEEHGGASLTISPDSDAAMRVYQQCESAGNFICYRANNAALVFDQGADPHALARVDGAIRALAGN